MFGGIIFRERNTFRAFLPLVTYPRKPQARRVIPRAILVKRNRTSSRDWYPRGGCRRNVSKTELMTQTMVSSQFTRTHRSLRNKQQALFPLTIFTRFFSSRRKLGLKTQRRELLRRNSTARLSSSKWRLNQ